MTLNDFLSTLKTSDIKITLYDNEANEIIKFYSEGYSGIESDILSRTITKFEIISNTALNIYLNSNTP